MKKTVNVEIGGQSFIIDEDAYYRLNNYLDTYKRGIKNSFDSNEIMADLESRIAELLTSELDYKNRVIDIVTVDKIATQLGLPSGSYADASHSYTSPGSEQTSKKFYRSKEEGKIGGVCAGLAYYFNLDMLLVRIIALIFLFCGTAGFWIYIILWIISPLAKTDTQKCEMRGWAPTPENLAKVAMNQN